MHGNLQIGSAAVQGNRTGSHCRVSPLQLTSYLLQSLLVNKMKNESQKYEDDDGRVICNMDVPGMRWHDRPLRRGLFSRQEPVRQSPRGDALTDSEARRYTWYAVLAGLLIVAIFSAVWVLFVLFCTKIWFV